MTLFQTGDFVLASGQRSRWKLECDALSPDDWAGLAAIAAEQLPPFGAVLGVPRGGLPFARALTHYVTAGPTLVVDDVWTTGGSMKKFIAERNHADVIGCVAFARNMPEPWVTPLFLMNGRELLSTVSVQKHEIELLATVNRRDIERVRAAINAERDHS